MEARLEKLFVALLFALSTLVVQVDARPSKVFHNASLLGLYTFAFAIFGVTGVQFYMLSKGDRASLLGPAQEQEIPVIFGDSRAHRQAKYRSKASDEARRELQEKRKEQYEKMPEWLQRIIPRPRENSELYDASARVQSEELSAAEGTLMWYIENDVMYKRFKEWMRN